MAFLFYMVLKERLELHMQNVVKTFFTNQKDKHHNKNQWDSLFSHQDGNFVELLQSFSQNNHWREFNRFELSESVDCKNLKVAVHGGEYSFFQFKERKGTLLIHITPKVYKTFQKHIGRAIKQGVMDEYCIIATDDEEKSQTITAEENEKYQEFVDKRFARMNALMKTMGVGAATTFVSLFTIPSIMDIKCVVMWLSLACAYCLTLFGETLVYCLNENDVCLWWELPGKDKYLLATTSFTNTNKTARYNLVVCLLLALIFYFIDIMCRFCNCSIDCILNHITLSVIAFILMVVSLILQFIAKNRRVLINIICSTEFALMLAAVCFSIVK